MACTVYQTNKKTGVVYAYRSESYRDPVTKRPKSRRTYLGRVDPDTHMIVDKAEEGKRNRTKLGTSSASKYMPEEYERSLNEKNQQILRLSAELEAYKKHAESTDKILLQLQKALSSFEPMAKSSK